jgi:hypothetical protein
VWRSSRRSSGLRRSRGGGSFRLHQSAEANGHREVPIAGPAEEPIAEPVILPDLHLPAGPPGREIRRLGGLPPCVGLAPQVTEEPHLVAIGELLGQRSPMAG